MYSTALRMSAFVHVRTARPFSVSNIVEKRSSRMCVCDSESVHVVFFVSLQTGLLLYCVIC